MFELSPYIEGDIGISPRRFEQENKKDGDKIGEVGLMFIHFDTSASVTDRQTELTQHVPR